ncbi:hypothetical protein HDU80_005623 [Chytriomyces hyalinus]|nr:hypothetical protein HDU80_005623 [Chytriomyces hyalinus]
MNSHSQQGHPPPRSAPALGNSGASPFAAALNAQMTQMGQPIPAAQFNQPPFNPQRGASVRAGTVASRERIAPALQRNLTAGPAPGTAHGGPSPVTNSNRLSGLLPPRERRQLPPRIRREVPHVDQLADDSIPPQRQPPPRNPSARINTTVPNNNSRTQDPASAGFESPSEMSFRRPSVRDQSSSLGRDQSSAVNRPPRTDFPRTDFPRSPRIAALDGNLGQFSAVRDYEGVSQSVTALIAAEYTDIGGSGDDNAIKSAFKRPGGPGKSAQRVSVNVVPQHFEQPRTMTASNERPRPPRRETAKSPQSPSQAPLETRPQILDGPLPARPGVSIPQTALAPIRPTFGKESLPGRSPMAPPGHRISAMKQQRPNIPLNVFMMEKGVRGSILKMTVLDESGAEHEVNQLDGDQEEWDESTDDEDENVFRLGKGAKVKKVLSGGQLGKKGVPPTPLLTTSADRGARKERDRALSPVRAAGKALKTPVQTKAPNLPASALRQSVLKFSHGGALAVNSKGKRDDDEVSDAATEEMDDVDYLDSYKKMAVAPVRGANASAAVAPVIPVPASESSSKRSPASNTSDTANVAAISAAAAAAAAAEKAEQEIAELQKQLDKEKSQGARLRQALELSKGDIAPILDLLQEKERQLEIFKEAVLAAKTAVDETRIERDEAVAGMTKSKGDFTQQLLDLESELGMMHKEREELELRLQNALNAKTNTEKNLTQREKERDEAEMELDTLMEERAATIITLEEKSKGLNTAETTLARLAKEVEDLKRREQESAKRLQDAEARVHATESALRKAETNANYAVNEVKTKGMVTGEIEEKLKLTMKDLFFAQAREQELEQKVKDAEMRLKFSEDALMESEMACENAVAEISALKSDSHGSEKILRDEIETLNNDLDQLATELDEKSVQVERAHDTIGDQDIKINALEADLESARDEIEANANAIDAMGQELNNARENKQNLLNQINELSNAHSNALSREAELSHGGDASMKALVAEREAWESKVLELEEILADSEMERDELKMRCQEMENDLDDLMRENSEKIESLTKSLQESQEGGEDSRVDELRHQLLAATSTVESLQRNISDLTVSATEREAANATQLKELEKAIEAASFEREEAEERIGELEMRLQNSDPVSSNPGTADEIHGLEEALAAAVAEKDMMQSELADLETQMDDIWAEKEGLHEKIESLQKELEDARFELEDAGQNVGAEGTGKEIQTLQQARDDALAEVKALQEQLQKVRADGVNLNAPGELEALLKERDEARSQLHVLKSDLANLEAMFEDAQKETEALQMKLQLSSNTNDSDAIQQLEQELDDLVAENEGLRKKLEDAENVPSNADNEILTLKSALADAHDQIEKLLEQVETGNQAGNSNSNDAAKIAELESQLEESRFEADDLYAKLEELDNAMSSDAKSAELEALLVGEKSRAATLDATNKSLTNEVTSLHERLARQVVLSKTDGDAQSVIADLENEISVLKSELDNTAQAFDELEAQFLNSENANKELNHALDLADQEIETLNRELDEVYEADTVKELEDTKLKLEECLARLENGEGVPSERPESSDIAKSPEQEMSQVESELRSRIAVLEDQAHAGKESLIQQLQEQQEDAKEMRETLVSRLRQQESEATTLREDLARLQSAFSESSTNLKAAEKLYDDFRSKTERLEKKYLERVDLVESALEQTFGEIESLRARIIQSCQDQGVEPPTFKPLEQLPPPNYEDKDDEAYDAPKTGFLSSLWKGRRPTITSPKEDKRKDKDLLGRPTVGSPQPVDDAFRPKTPSSPPDAHGAKNAGVESAPQDNSSTSKPDLKSSLKGKQSTGILSSLWGGRKNPEDASSSAAASTTVNAPPVTPGSEVASETAPGAMDVKQAIVGADDDDAPQQPPSKFLASIWGAKSKLKRTDSEPA